MAASLWWCVLFLDSVTQAFVCPAAARSTLPVLTQPRPIMDSGKVALLAIDGNDGPPSPPPEPSFPSSTPPAPPFSLTDRPAPLLMCPTHPVKTRQRPVTVEYLAAYFGGGDSPGRGSPLARLPRPLLRPLPRLPLPLPLPLPLTRTPKKAFTSSVSYRSRWPRPFGARPGRISRQRLFSDSREKSSSSSAANSRHSATV